MEKTVYHLSSDYGNCDFALVKTKRKQKQEYCALGTALSFLFPFFFVKIKNKKIVTIVTSYNAFIVTIYLY